MELLNASSAATEYTSLSAGTTTVLNTNTAAEDPNHDVAYKAALIGIYVVVLGAGGVGLVLMVSILKANLRSWTTIALLNLILAHLIFLLTVPFRIYYYATDNWNLPGPFCKMVSAMIHLHMHIVFFIYVILLTVNFLHHYKILEQMQFDRKLHAVAASAGVWSVVVIVVPITLYYYGTEEGHKQNKCFDFETAVNKTLTKVLNGFLSVGTVLTSIVLTGVLVVILHSLLKKHGPASRAHQEFWAQMKNVSLVLIVIICLVPCHIFRLFYLTDPITLKKSNEFFLALTALTCFDMLLLFSGKGICQRCGVC
ncbi:G protein-coupled receptor 141 [Brachyhypopomus gauderio]|uniref:G protein-coupled receptor 141 n=1 Tax=Brachyhypopomus gauderio TaxID=698409 RepID=UPI004041FC10